MKIQRKLSALLASLALICAMIITASATDIAVGIGDGYDYNTLTDAIENADDGDTIILSSGTFEAPTEIKKSLTIRGAGSDRTEGDNVTTLCFSDTLSINNPNISVTFASLNLEMKDDFSNYVPVFKIDQQENVALTIKDVHMEACDNGVNELYASIYLKAATSPTIHVENSYLYGKNVIYVTSDSSTNNATYHISDSYFIGCTTGFMRGENTTYSATNTTFHGFNDLNFASGNDYSTFMLTNGAIAGEYTFDNCAFVTESLYGNQDHALEFQLGASNNDVTFDTCTFNLQTTAGHYVKVSTSILPMYSKTENNTITVKETEDEEGATYGVSADNYYDIIGGYLVVDGAVAINLESLVSYTSLNAATSDETITLFQNTTLSTNDELAEGVTLVIPTGITLTIDDATLNSNGTIENYGAIFGTVSGVVNHYYTITVDGNGGMPSVETVITTTGGTIALPTATLSDYSLNGWYLEDGTQVTDEYVFISDATISASWSKNTNSSNKGTLVSTTTSKTDDDSTTTVEEDEITAVAEDTTTETVEVTETSTATPSDVDADAYYGESVTWAVENGITTGKSDGTFAPDESATRADVLTLLYRAVGAPEIQTTSVFDDVDESSYYGAAVAWAVKNGITQGMADSTFGSGNTCTRAQIITFLWRVAGSPEMEGSHNFSDVDLDSYYQQPLLWAMELGITTGMSDDSFAPDAPCTRGQIVTFLYRYLV